MARNRGNQSNTTSRSQLCPTASAIACSHSRCETAPTTPGRRLSAVGLLKRVVDEYDDFLQVPFSHELLGRAYRRSGDLTQAETHFKLAIETADEHRNGLSPPELELAEVMIEAGRQEAAATQLHAAEQLEPGMVWNSQLFRHAVARARVEHQIGRDPTAWAQRAIDLADDAEPQLPRHPTVGLVKASPDELREMKRIATRPTKRRWRRA